MSRYRWHVTEINRGILEEADEDIRSVGGKVDPSDDNIATWDLYDDDGNWYARGLISGDHEGFEPLDDWGSGALGCTGIKIDGEWL